MKTISIEEEVRLEGVIELSCCQKQIRRKDPYESCDDLGVECVCDKAGIGFYDPVYLSKYTITETCKRSCPHLKK